MLTRLWHELRDWWACQCCPYVRRHRAYCGAGCLDFPSGVSADGVLRGNCRGCRSCPVHVPKPPRPQPRLIISEGPYR